MIKIVSHGDFKKTKKFLNYIDHQYFYKVLDKYGEKGVQALSAATPIDTGVTAASWGYAVHTTKTGGYIVWTNNAVAGDTTIPIVVLIQYGHATKNGGFVMGRDFINPAIRPIFDEIADKVWEEVVNA